MRLGTFYNTLLNALNNGEINSISDGMRELAEAGICYYEVFADTIENESDEAVLVSALEENGCRVGNLYFKKVLKSPSRQSADELLDYTMEKIEQCRRIHCSKLMPVITVCGDDGHGFELLHDYYKRTSEISDRYGILTVFENYTSSVTKTFRLDDIEYLMKGSDKLSYVLDTGNFWFAKENACSAVHRFKDRIARVHLKDILPIDGSVPDSGQIKVHYTALGGGVSPVKDCIKQLRKSGYDSGFTIEIGNSAAVMKSILKSVDLVKQSEKEIQSYMAALDSYSALFEYASGYEYIGEEIELKIIHMLSVASLMNSLGLKLNVDEHLHRLAVVTGLYHDIGRFEQFKTYHTFRDSVSTDHADLSVQILENGHFLDDLSGSDRAMVLTAIRNHNKYVIEENLDADTLLLCRMIRDADKIDCFRVVSSEPYESSYAVTAEELKQSEISREVFESIMRHELVKNTERKFPLDYILSCCAFVFDINFPASKEIIKQKNRYLCRLNTISYSNPVTERDIKKIFREIDEYLDE